MVTMKGLPLAYSKDMQDDKEPVFEARDLLMISLQALAGMIETVEFVPERMRAAAAAGLFDRDRPRRLAGARGRRAVPRSAPHHRPRGEAGGGARLRARRAVRSTISKRIDPRIDERVFDVLSVEASVASRTSYGGTAPARVREQIAKAKEELGL